MITLSLSAASSAAARNARAGTEALGVCWHRAQMLGHKLKHVGRGHEVAALSIGLRIADHFTGSEARCFVSGESASCALVSAAEFAGCGSDVTGAAFGDNDCATHWPPSFL